MRCGEDKTSELAAAIALRCALAHYPNSGGWNSVCLAKSLRWREIATAAHFTTLAITAFAVTACRSGGDLDGTVPTAGFRIIASAALWLEAVRLKAEELGPARGTKTISAGQESLAPSRRCAVSYFV